ncbi:MAG: hypothetical protein RIM72_14380 [Alphaproteobacteria bacterium]
MASTESGDGALTDQTVEPAEPAETTETPAPAVPDTSFGGRLLQSLPPHMTESLTDEDKAEFATIADRVRGAYWTGSHAVDARYTVPWFSRRFYMRIMAGQENRDPNRVKTENKEKSVSRSAVNVAGIGVAVLIFYIVLGIALLSMSLFL